MRFVHARADDRMCTCGFRVQSDDEFDRHLDERRVSAVFRLIESDVSSRN